MPLQFKNIAVGNLQDDVSGNNYAANKAVYILNLNNTLAQIFSDEDGTTPIIQDGVNNVTGVRGVFGFWVEAGDYFVQVGANKYRVSITGADYFNNRVDETIDIIVDSVAGRGAYYVVGSFEAGFTYTDINQVGTFGGTDYYIYTGGLTNLPHNVTAGTDPTLSSDYAQVFYGEIDNVQGLRDELNRRAIKSTIADALLDDAPVGTLYTIKDRDNAPYEVVAGSDTGGIFTTTMISGRKLRLGDVDELRAEYLPGIADYPTDISAAIQEAGEYAIANNLDLVFGPFKRKFSVTFTSGLNIRCEKGFENEPALATSEASIKFNGTASTNTYQLASALTRSDSVFNLSTPPTDIANGDYIIIQDDSRRQSDNANQINMEVHRVLDVTGSQITLYDKIREIKAVHADNVYKITMCENPRVEGFSYQAISGSTANIGIFYDMCVGAVTRNIKARNSASDCVTYRRCFDVATYEWDVADPLDANASGQGYGIAHAKGTMKTHLGTGRGKNMRHAVDYDSCYDNSSDIFDDINSRFGGVLLAHNGFGGDFTDFKFRSTGDFQACYFPPNTVAGSDAYTKPAHNVNVKVWCDMARAGGAYGFYSEQALIDSNIQVYATFGDGSKPTSFISNTAAVRLPSSSCKGTKITINTVGAISALSRQGAAEAAELNDLKADITARNVYQPTLLQNCPVVELTLDIDNSDQTILQYSGSATLRKLIIDANVINSNVDFTNATNANTSASGCVGSIKVFDDNADLPITLTNGNQITLNQILKALDGEVLRVTCASAITLAAQAFELGLITGQRLIITSDQNANTIDIPSSVQVQNNGNASVQLGLNKRSAMYVMDNAIGGAGAGRWYQVS